MKNHLYVLGVRAFTALSLFVSSVMSTHLHAQMITTFAGGESIFDSRTTGVIRDGAGNTYYSDVNVHRVVKVSPDGAATTIAGTGTAGSTGDGGPATEAKLNWPWGLALDGSGNLYIAEFRGHRIRKVTPSGVIATFAGTGVAGFGGDGGPAAAAEISSPLYMAISSSGDVFVTANGRVRRISSNGIISTYAGGTCCVLGDNGPALEAYVANPSGIALAPDGTLFVSEILGYRVRKIAPNGLITTYAGTGVSGLGGDGGPATSAQFGSPMGLALDAVGNLYIAESGGYRVRRVSTDGTTSTVAGGGTRTVDGVPATSAGITFLGAPTDVAIDANGNLYIAGGQLQVVDTNRIIRRLVVRGPREGEPYFAISANIKRPQSVAVDAAGNLYVADTLNHRIKKVARSGLISNFAGNGVAASTGDGGTALGASLNAPAGFAIDVWRNVYVSESAGHRVRRVDPSGVITTFAGTGVAGLQGDNGAATSAQLTAPSALAVDRSGNLYIVETQNHRIRRVSTTGMISNFAGTGVAGFSGDGAQATSAMLHSPSGVGVDSSGTVWIADTNNNRIRRVAANGVITTVVGTGVAGFAGDGGVAANAQLSQPTGITFDTRGGVYISDTGNSRIRKLNTAGLINTVVGSGAVGFAGDDSRARSAALNTPLGITTDVQGNLYIADQGNDRVRRVTNIFEHSAFDFNGDGKSDLSIRHTNGNGVRYLMNGTRVGVSGQGGISSQSQVTDLNDDGKADIQGQSFGGFVSTCFMDGIDVISCDSFAEDGHVLVADFNGDRRPDRLIVRQDGMYLFVPAFNDGGLLLDASSGWSLSHIADLNGDGKSDLILKHANGALFVYLMNGYDVAGGGFILGPGTGWSISHVADLDGDRNADLILKHTDGSVYVYLMNGATVTSGGFLLGPGTGWTPILTGDMNGDGNADIVLESTTGASFIYLMNGTSVVGGGFTQFPGSPYRVTHMFDYNGDSKSDLILRNVNDGTTMIWLMDGTTVREAAQLLGPNSGWTVSPPQVR